MSQTIKGRNVLQREEGFFYESLREREKSVVLCSFIISTVAAKERKRGRRVRT